MVLALVTAIGIDIEKWELVFIEIDGLLVPFFIDKILISGELTAIVAFNGISGETKAKKILNCEVYQLKSLVPEPGLVDSDRVKGYNVIDINAGNVGKIDSILYYNKNHLLRILKGEKEILIPWVENIIININHKKKEVIISAPDGLLDIN